MCRMSSFILKHFELDESDKQHVPSIVADIKCEMDEFGESQISEYELADRFDEKLAEILDKKEAV